MISICLDFWRKEEKNIECKFIYSKLNFWNKVFEIK